MKHTAIKNFRQDAINFLSRFDRKFPSFVSDVYGFDYQKPIMFSLHIGGKFTVAALNRHINALFLNRRDFREPFVVAVVTADAYKTVSIDGSTGRPDFGVKLFSVDADGEIHLARPESDRAADWFTNPFFLTKSEFDAHRKRDNIITAIFAQRIDNIRPAGKLTAR